MVGFLSVRSVVDFLMRVPIVVTYHYRATRTGHIRVLSFKVGIILLCRANLEDKFKCKYRSNTLLK